VRESLIVADAGMADDVVVAVPNLQGYVEKDKIPSSDLVQTTTVGYLVFADEIMALEQLLDGCLKVVCIIRTYLERETEVQVGSGQQLDWQLRWRDCMFVPSLAVKFQVPKYQSSSQHDCYCSLVWQLDQAVRHESLQ